MRKQAPVTAAQPVRNPGSDWDDNLPVDQTPPPDHEDFMAVQANGLRYIRERWERRRRNRLLQLERDGLANTIAVEGAVPEREEKAGDTPAV